MKKRSLVGAAAAVAAASAFAAVPATSQAATSFPVGCGVSRTIDLSPLLRTTIYTCELAAVGTCNEQVLTLPTAPLARGELRICAPVGIGS